MPLPQIPERLDAPKKDEIRSFLPICQKADLQERIPLLCKSSSSCLIPVIRVQHQKLKWEWRYFSVSPTYFIRLTNSNTELKYLVYPYNVWMMQELHSSYLSLYL